MADWRSLLNSDPMDWLLEKENPSIQYITLRDLIGLPSFHLEVIEAEREIMRTGAVPRILGKQNQGGYWGKPEDFYMRSKYKGTVWQLIILASLHADGGDERVKRACEFILENSQDKESGGFAYRSSGNGGNHSGVIPCLTSNMVWSLMNLGYENDERVKKGIGWIMKYQRFENGIAPNEWPYSNHKRCWTPRDCRSAAVKALKALVQIPEEARSNRVKNHIKNGAEFVLDSCLSNNLKATARSEWFRFGFPLMWNTDLLEILDVLLATGLRDDRMSEAIDYVASNQNSNGQWSLETTFNGRFLVNIERMNRPSKWITLHAMRVLKNYHS